MKITISKPGTFNLKSCKLSKDDNIYDIDIIQGIDVTVIDDTAASNTVQFTLNQDSKLQYSVISRDLDVEEMEKTLTFTLAGRGAQIKVRCMCEGKNSAVYKFKTYQHHKSPDTISDLELKSVLHDDSKLFCNNLIRIEKDAQRVNAREQNKNLLLGDNAKVITIPKLEVEADDVSAQHGAAISRVDTDHMFYLQSRGMDYKTAKSFLIEAFLN